MSVPCHVVRDQNCPQYLTGLEWCLAYSLCFPESLCDRYWGDKPYNGRFHTRRRTNRLTVCSTNVNSRWSTPLISRQISYKPLLLLLVPLIPLGPANRPFVRLSPRECEFRSDFGRLVHLDGQIVFTDEHTDGQTLRRTNSDDTVV